MRWVCVCVCVPEQVSVSVLQQGGAQQVQVTEGGQVMIQEQSFLHQQERDEVHQPTTNTHTAQTHKLTPHTSTHRHRRRDRTGLLISVLNVEHAAPEIRNMSEWRLCLQRHIFVLTCVCVILFLSSFVHVFLTINFSPHYIMWQTICCFTLNSSYITRFICGEKSDRSVDPFRYWSHWARSEEQETGSDEIKHEATSPGS